jgi:hypothetical protein
MQLGSRTSIRPTWEALQAALTAAKGHEGDAPTRRGASTRPMPSPSSTPCAGTGRRVVLSWRQRGCARRKRVIQLRPGPVGHVDHRAAAGVDQGAGGGGDHPSRHSGSQDGEGDGHRDRAQVTGARAARPSPRGPVSPRPSAGHPTGGGVRALDPDTVTITLNPDTVTITGGRGRGRGPRITRA